MVSNILKIIILLGLFSPITAYAYVPLINCSNDGAHALTSTANPQTYSCTAISGGGGSSTLGTSATVPAPYASVTDTQTGLYTAGAGRIDFTIAGAQKAEINTNGLGIGTSFPLYPLDIWGTSTSTSASAVGSRSYLSVTPSGASSATYNGIYSSVQFNGSNNTSGAVNGIKSVAEVVSIGTANQVSGVYGIAQMDSTPTSAGSASLYGGHFQSVYTGTGAFNHEMGIKIDGPVSSGTSVIAGDLYLQDVNTNSPLATTKFGILMEGSGSDNAMCFGNGASVCNARFYSSASNVTNLDSTSAFLVNSAGTGAMSLGTTTIYANTFTTTNISGPPSTALNLKAGNLLQVQAGFLGNGNDYIVLGGTSNSTTPAQIFVTGTDSNIILSVASRGTGTLNLGNGSSNPQVKIVPTNSAVDFINMTGGSTAAVGTTAISASGTDTNVALILTAKGTGGVNSTSNIGIGSNTPLVSLDAGQKTDAILLPSGTTGQRPSSPVNGMVRYNTTLSTLEGYARSVWGSFNLNSPVFYAKNYGVKCDGTTDDSSAINTLIPLAIGYASGAVIEFPVGTCLMHSASVNITGTNTNLTLRGQGQNKTIIQTDATLANGLLYINSATGITVNDLTVNTSGTSTRAANIDCNSQNTNFNNVGYNANNNGDVIFNQGDTTVFTNNFWYLTSPNTWALNYNKNVSDHTGSLCVYAGNNHMVNGGSVYGGSGSGGQGIKVTQTGSGTLWRVEGVTIHGWNYISDGAYGIQIGNSLKVTVSDSIVDQWTSNGIYIGGGADAVSIDNTYSGTIPPTTNKVGIYVDYTAGTGTTLTGNTSYNVDRGIWVAADATHHVPDVKIIGNTFAYVSLWTILLDSVTNAVVSGNNDSSTPTNGSLSTYSNYGHGHYSISDNIFAANTPANIDGGSSTYDISGNSGIFTGLGSNLGGTTANVGTNLNVGGNGNLTGYLTIGTTNPIVYSLATGGNGAVISNTYGITVANSTGSPLTLNNTNSGSGVSNTINFYRNGGFTGYIGISTNSMAIATSAEAMRIDGSQNVIIGTTNPVVSGFTQGNNGAVVSNTYGVSVANTSVPMTLNNTAGGVIGTAINLYRNGAAQGLIGVGSSNIITINTSGEALRIDGSKNVMISTTSPSVYNLGVGGLGITLNPTYGVTSATNLSAPFVANNTTTGSASQAEISFYRNGSLAGTISANASTQTLSLDASGGIIMNGVTYPVSNGTNLQFLQTNGSGTASWASPSTIIAFSNGNNSQAGGTTYYMGPSCLFLSFSNTCTFVAPYAFTAKNMTVYVNSSPGSGHTITYTLQHGFNTDGNQTCSIANAATSCSDSTHTDTIAAGDIISIKIASGALSTTVFSSVSIEAIRP